MLRLSTVTFAVVVLAGCATPPSYSSSPSYGSSSTQYQESDLSPPTIKNDQYSPSIQVRSEGGKRGQVSQGKGVEIWGLFANVGRQSGAVVTYVQWGEVYWDKAWRFYSRASTNKGQSLSFDTVDRKVTRCSHGTCVYSETYNIMLTSADMRAGAKDGISFKIYGREGDERVITIPASIVEQFNEKVVEAQKLRKV